MISGLKEFLQSLSFFERMSHVSFKAKTALKVPLHSGFPYYESKRLPSPSAGKVIRTPTGYTAFIPAKLPPRLTYDGQFVLSLSRADSALSELSGLGRYLPNPHLLIAPYVRREAVLSSRIEGTRASLSDLLLISALNSA